MKLLPLFESVGDPSKFGRYLMRVTNGKMYHFTFARYTRSIKKDGLIPRLKPNSHYEDGCEGVFLSVFPRISQTNIPMDIAHVYGEWGDLDSPKPRPKGGPCPVIRVTVDISQLEPELFGLDDSYAEIERDQDKDTETRLRRSLKFGALCYQGDIPPSAIIEITDKFPF